MPSRLRFAVFVLAASLTASGQTYTISTFAGGGGLPNNVPGVSTWVAAPWVAADQAGNTYFEDSALILRLDAGTGLLTVVAGNGLRGTSGDNGPATDARVNPAGIALDSSGNVYFADTGSVRKVSHGVITTVANLASPSAALTVDAADNVYIVDFVCACVRKFTPNGVGTVVAGGHGYGFSGDNGPAISALLGNSLQALAIDSAGSLYIADTSNLRVRKISGGVITTVAGNGPSNSDPGQSNNGTFSGDNGPATSAGLVEPQGIAVDSAGNLYITDGTRVRKVTNGIITTVAGNGAGGFGNDGGLATSAPLYADGVAVDATGDLYIAAYTVRKVSRGVITTVAGNETSVTGPPPSNGPATNVAVIDPTGVAVDSSGNVYIADGYISKVSSGLLTPVAGGNGSSVAVDPSGGLFTADEYGSSVLQVSGGVSTRVAGSGVIGAESGFSGDNGPATSAQLNNVYGVAADSAGNLYIADTGNNRVRKVSGGVITTIAGNGAYSFSGDNGPAVSAQLQPTAVAVDLAGDVYVADTYNSRIRKISGGVITTIAGGGNGTLNQPYGVAVDASGNVFIADTFNQRILKVSNGLITTIAGNGTAGLSGDNGPATSAQLDAPDGIAVDSAGNIYVADAANARIRLLKPDAPPNGPAIYTAGIVAVDSTVTTIQPGEWVSIYGNNLGPATGVTWTGNFPQSLGGTSVTVDGNPAYLSYVSAGQINLQAPNDSNTGPVSVVVNTTGGTSTSTVTLAPFAPSFLLLDSKHVTGIIVRTDGSGSQGGGTYDFLGPTGNSLGFPTVAAKAGDSVELFAVGLGPTNPSVSAGAAFTGGAAPTTNQVNLLINNVSVTPGFAGFNSSILYQINVTIPAGLGTGDVPLVGTVSGFQTQSNVVISLQ